MEPRRRHFSPRCPKIYMGTELLFREIRTPMRGLQLVVATLLLATAIFSGVVLLGVGIYPLDLEITTLSGTGSIVFLVLPLLVARAIVPGRIVDLGVRQIAAGRWPAGQRPGSPTDTLIKRTGDIGRLWQLYATQELAGTFLVAAAATVSLAAYIFARSAPPLALGTILVVAISSHFPTKPIVSRWMAMHLYALEVLRQPGR